MFRSAVRSLGFLGPLSAAAALSLGTLPAFAVQAAPGECSSIQFQLSNPDPGARVEIGNNVIQGIALDVNSPDGVGGVDRVDFFLGNRDSGGVLIGSAIPDTEAGPFGPGSFQTTITLPNQMGAHDLFAYAHDGAAGKDVVISQPISIGESPSQAFAMTPPSEPMETCMVGENSTVAGTTGMEPQTNPASTAPSVTESNSMISHPSAATIMLDIANPSAGDSVHVGATMIKGTAFDLDAPDATGGIDRIQVMLDSREQGGILVGQAATDGNTWSTTINIPPKMLGSHTLWFYAHSTITDQEMAASVPIMVVQ